MLVVCSFQRATWIMPADSLHTLSRFQDLGPLFSHRITTTSKHGLQAPSQLEDRFNLRTPYAFTNGVGIEHCLLLVLFFMLSSQQHLGGKTCVTPACRQHLQGDRTVLFLNLFWLLMQHGKRSRGAWTPCLSTLDHHTCGTLSLGMGSTLGNTRRRGNFFVHA